MDLILTSVGISGKSLREAVNCNTFVLTSSEEKVYAITFLNEEAGQCNIAGPSFGSGTRAFITFRKTSKGFLEATIQNIHGIKEIRKIVFTAIYQKVDFSKLDD